MTALIKNRILKKKYPERFSIFLIFIFFITLLCSFSPDNIEKKWIVVIDAGHGGKDPGAVGAITVEKKITLVVALKTGEYLEKNLKNVKVIYTRKTDTFVEVRDRAIIANENNADLFISIHTNGVASKTVQGSETFIMGLAKDKANLEVAMKENEVILLEDDYSTKYEGFDPKSPESYIMFTLMQNIYQQQSANLASKMQSQYKNRISRIDRGVKQAGFWVLFMTTMPSVLTELGFITHPAEEKFLNSTEGQDYLASAIFRACREYITEIESRSGISAVINNGGEIVSHDSVATSPAGSVVFMVQIASSILKRELKPENFNGIDELYEIAENDRFKYASGKFANYTEAVKYRGKIEKRYPGAFVIAVKDNKTIPLQQAIEQKK
jgi:N-acetylmuramoyl-L-alanine amidase